VNLLVFHVERGITARRFQEHIGKGQQVFLLSVLNHQQRGLTGSKLNIGYESHAASPVNHFTSYEIANVRCAGFELCALRSRDLQLTSQECLCVSDGIDAFQLQNQTALVWPKFFQFDFAPLIVLSQRKQVHAGGEAVGVTGVQLDSDLAVAALRF